MNVLLGVSFFFFFKADQKLQSHKRQWFRSEGLYEGLQEMIQDHCVRKHHSTIPPDQSKVGLQCDCTIASYVTMHITSNQNQAENFKLHFASANLKPILHVQTAQIILLHYS